MAKKNQPALSALVPLMFIDPIRVTVRVRVGVRAKVRVRPVTDAGILALYSMASVTVTNQK